MDTSGPPHAPWLLLAFTLPANRSSERVQLWRRLRKFGVLSLKSAGYLLPNNGTNRERFEWLAVAVRKYKGQASVAEVLGFHDISDQELRAQFTAARTRDYQLLTKEMKKLKAPAQTGDLSRIRRQLNELAAIDFFGSPVRRQVEEALLRLESPQTHHRKEQAMKTQPVLPALLGE
jgi:hypothetical protein